jgi:glucose-1-phosphate thymidylyltransferase
MRIIVPMAGWGSRLRPHTLTVPKPMLKIAGKSIVERLISNISNTIDSKIESISFIIREDFGKEIEKQLLEIADKYKTKAHICYQDEPLGTGHAILCAQEQLGGPVVVGFADTMFDADFKIDTDSDAVIWVKQIPNPEAFGVIKLDANGTITEFIEKPKDFISDLAIIGIYYFKDGNNLREELQYLIDKDLREKGEYQLTTAMEHMRQKGKIMRPGEVKEWLDCGNKNATVESNTAILQAGKDAKIEGNIVDSTIIPPCYIEAGTLIEGSVIGPNVSIGKGSTIKNSIISHTIIQENSVVEKRILSNTMIGSKAMIIGRSEDLSVGDYNQIQ